ncbi:nucleoside phosphatase family-domain-containing protein [Lentinula lateritia]|uniref:guanosine-diphosphatase n=1 Tax=Lentinula lateritia TaxID=40482 RepID=A0ABQ8VER4_9AGAR|nr:nucleoside phosphatase family-domain-containing protein [Lentinula lateritia]
MNGSVDHRSGSNDINSTPSFSTSSGRSTGAVVPTINIASHSRSRSLHLHNKPGNLASESTDRQGTNIQMAISPRSSNYERLEGGMGPSRMGNKKRFAWKKIAIAAVVLVGLVWVFGPREPAKVLSWPSDDTVDENPIDPVVPPIPDADKPTPPNNSESNKPSSSNTHPTSFEEDTDPTKTTHCTTPYASHLPLVQYALMIDAGSTGSRIHVYKFNNCGSSPSYEYEVFKQRQPGLSKFAGQPNDAAESLDVLLDEAVRVVPSSLRACTPVAVKATAGLRLLPGSQSKDILDAVAHRIQEKYPFQLHEPDGVVIMDGKDEGVYAWITANYLLNTIRADTPADTPTYAVLDLGGASTQIVFEPTFSEQSGALEEGEHKYELEFGGRTHILYQHSYLGYGLMRARAHVHQLVEFMASIRNPGQSAVDTMPATIGNPCLARGTKRNVDIEDERTKTTKTVVMDGEQIGSFEACNRVIELVMAKDSICELKPCSFNGVYQPSLLDSFTSGKVLLLSYFFDRLDPLLSAEFSSSSSTDPIDKINVSAIASIAEDVCLGYDAWTARWGTNQEVMEELQDRPEWCLDLTFMHSLLRLGYEFGDERDVVLGKKIQDTELGWCLGATIAIVGSGNLKCRLIA